MVMRPAARRPAAGRPFRPRPCPGRCSGAARGRCPCPARRADSGAGADARRLFPALHGGAARARAWSGASSRTGASSTSSRMGSLTPEDPARTVTADSLFRIASMSKAFTALAILKLRDAGRLRLDALAEELCARRCGAGVTRPRTVPASASATCSAMSAASSPTIPGATGRAAARGGLHRDAPPGRAVHPRAGQPVRIFEFRLCPARPDRHQRLRAGPSRTISSRRSCARSA